LVRVVEGRKSVPVTGVVVEVDVEEEGGEGGEGGSAIMSELVR